MPKNNFYSMGPQVPSSKISNRPPIGNANLSAPTPKMVPTNPGKSSGLGGAAHTFGHPPTGGSHGFGHSVIQRLGSIRISGIKGAHHIGKR